MPGGKTKKNPNIEADSKAFFDQLELDRKKRAAEATKIITEKLANAASRIVTLVDAVEMSDDAARTAKIQLDAAKYALKIGGLEVERVEEFGNKTLTISFEHAKKVFRAANGL